MVEVVIPQSQLTRIAGSITSDPRSVSQASRKDNELHDLSSTKSALWTNTNRANLKAAVALRECKRNEEERYRRALDSEEASRRQENRVRALSEANDKIRLQTSAMRELMSAMMYADVLCEREKQVAVKQSLRKLEAVRNRKYDELIKHNVKSILERETVERESRLKKSVEIQKAQLEQVQANHRRRKLEKEWKLVDASRMKGMQDNYIKEEQEKMNQTKMRLRAAHRETLAAQRYSEELKRREHARCQAEEALIAKFAAEKERTATMHKEREKQITDAKLESRQRLIDKQIQELQSRRDHEDARVEQQVQSREETEDRIRAEAAKDSLKRREDIEADRIEQIGRKQRSRDLRILEEKQAAARSTETVKALELHEQREKEKRRCTMKALSDEYRFHVESKRSTGKEVMKRSGFDSAMQGSKSDIRGEDIEFTKYAENILKEYTEGGKTTIPI